MVMIILIFASILSTEVGNGNSVKLTPGPEAPAKEGERLDLNCEYSGSSYPDFINWYLNGDPFGLVIYAMNCSYYTKPKVYETDRYKPSCNTTSFTLSIVNISRTNDNGDQWGCDSTIIGMDPPSKASTTIKVLEEDGKSGGSAEPNNLPSVMGAVFGCVLVMIVVVAVACFLSRRLRKEIIGEVL